jgi:hypothetical protein
MLAPNQTLLLHDYFTRSRDLWLLCEQYDCDHDQMLQIIGAITPHLPGKGLDYQAILNQDPIACDHLVLHCQRSIGQLDALYDRLISLFDSSSSHDLQINKRTTVNTPPDWAKPSFSDGEFRWDTSKGSEKVETTTLENKQRFRILDSAMKCLERGLKMQITLTQRKEKLSKEQLSQEKLKKTSPRAQQEDSPFSGISAFSAMQPYQGMTGYHLDELESPSPNANLPASSNQDPVSRDATRSAHPQRNAKPTNNMAHKENPREEEPVTLSLSAPPRETLSPFGPPKEFAYPPHIAELMPNRYPWRKELKEKQAARKATLLPISATSASPRETSFTSPEEEAPAYHQRE